MKGYALVQWDLFNGRKNFLLKRVSNPGLLDQQDSRLTYWATGSPGRLNYLDNKYTY